MINRPRSRARKPGAAPQPMHGATARPPQPREGSHARHPHTGPGAEGGGGWPMHATAQPWHAEGRPPPTGALRRRAVTADNLSVDHRCQATPNDERDRDSNQRPSTIRGFSCLGLADPRMTIGCCAADRALASPSSPQTRSMAGRRCWLRPGGYLAPAESLATSAAFARSKAAAVPDWLAHG